MSRLEDDLKVRGFRNPRHKLSVNIIFTSNWLVSQMQDTFKNYGITMQQFNILRILRGQHPNPCTIQTLKERMIDKQSDVSRLIDRIAQKGLVERRPNESDRRKSDTLITDQGLVLLAALDEEMHHFEDLMGPLNEDEIVQMNTLLDKLRD